jgi:hypothetical protein
MDLRTAPLIIDSVEFPVEWRTAVMKYRDQMNEYQIGILREHLIVAREHLAKLLVGQESIRRVTDDLAHIGLTVECNVASPDESKASLADWVVRQLNNPKAKRIDKVLPGGIKKKLGPREPEILPAFAKVFGVDVIILSSRKKPMVFGELAIESTRPLICLFHAADSIAGISQYCACIVAKEDRPVRHLQMPKALNQVWKQRDD